MLLDLDGALQDVETELAAARERQEKLTAYIESLQAEAHGLRLALARHSGDSEVASASNGQAARWRRYPRTDAILAVLEEADTPMGPADITRELHTKGREDERAHVAAALAYLKRKGRVQHLTLGEWAAREPQETQVDLGLEGGDVP
jgi:hypothetical protein